VRRKSKPDLAPLLTDLAPEGAALLEAFVDLQGGAAVLQRAAELFAAIPAAAAALDEVAALVDGVRLRHPELAVHVDLAELRGYHYHTGVVFAAYAQGLGEALARGGRYDNVGAVYGRARPATGFATDLRLLAAQVPPAAQATTAILAPDSDDPALQRRVRELRAAGEIVIVALGATDDLRCGQILTHVDGQWRVLPLTEKEQA
jgi:ATP phosphoribosyltransferase regulatory subunit